MGTKKPPSNHQAEPSQASPRHQIWPALRVLLKTRIVAGLLTIIPLWVTWKIVEFVFNTMRSATEPIVRSVAQAIVAENENILPSVVQNYVEWIVPLLAVLLTLFLLYLLGLLGANVFGRRLLLLMEHIFGKLPLIKTIYRSTKQIVTTLGGGQSMHFRRVVLVEFPRPGMKCIGFLTAVMKDIDTGRKMASIFVSTTPNPTTGYMQIVPLDEVSETSWTVEEAVKLLMSGGILSPPTVPFDRIHPVDWPDDESKEPETDENQTLAPSQETEPRP